eukprot:CAMPEP_0115640208 /NCGR_PEP_ID=MMETSP0272-20121206/35667_1 /TAXON_ID=71861 /ORGANISM="Scrippsiella trochoidea, Strain CCMP3099" /LENGTH=464 /DNA_ID=CAMNT_0003077439 /DNA_START=96 /DNA_END=1492 /DNA_ORIENTATION=-
MRYKGGRRLEKHYKVNKVLKGENRSPVSLVTGNADGRKYAVKSFKKDGLSKDKLVLLRRETEVPPMLDHPHVARLHEVLETERELHLVMEHLAGGELHDHAVRQRCYSEAQAAGIARQMLLTLAYLHAHHVAHRDLKLENWMYQAPGSDFLKLIDFGLARWLGRDPNATMTRACGSLNFVAPEMFSQAYTEKVDIWSLGVIAYILLTASPLFQGKDDAEVKSKIKRAEFGFCKEFYQRSELAQDFMRRLLAVDPNERLSAEQALRHPWIAASHKREAPPLDALSALRGLAVAPPNHSLEAAALFSGAGVVAPEAEVEVVFQNLDMDSDGELAYNEVLAALLRTEALEVGEDLVRATFAGFDGCGGCRGRVAASTLRALLPAGSEAAVLVDGLSKVEAEESEQSDEPGSREELLARSVAIYDEDDGGMSFEDFYSFLYGELPDGEDSMFSLSPVAGRRKFALCGG